MVSSEESRTYLSIGKFAKLTRATIKSLRYYERLGVLEPAYINPETGYRYYDFHQVYRVSLIRMFVEEGMPIKDLQQFFAEGDVLQASDLFAQFEKLAAERHRKSYATMVRMQSYQREYNLQITADILKEREFISQKSRVFAIPFDEKLERFTYQHYSAKLSDALLAAQNMDFITLAQQGLYFADDGEWYVFVQILAEEGQEEILADYPRDDLFIFDTPQETLTVRTTLAGDVTRCFREAVVTDVPGTPRYYSEVWAYAFVMGIYAVNTMYLHE